MVVRIFLLISLVSLESTGVAASAETIPCGINGECPNNLFCCGPPIGCWDNDHCPSPPYLDCPEKKTVGDTCYEIDEYNYPQDNSQYGCNLPCTYKKVGDHGDEKFCFKQPGLLPVTKGCTPEQITTEVGFCGDQNFTCQAPNTNKYCCSPNEICGCYGCWRRDMLSPVCPACPQICDELYEPICGVNNVTYANKCFGCEVATACNGECPCKGLCEINSDCPTGETCCPPENVDGPGQCSVDCPGYFVTIWDCLGDEISGNVTFDISGVKAWGLMNGTAQVWGYGGVSTVTAQIDGPNVTSCEALNNPGDWETGFSVCSTFQIGGTCKVFPGGSCDNCPAE